MPLKEEAGRTSTMLKTGLQVRSRTVPSRALAAINCTNTAGGGVYSFHPGCVNVLLTDGSVQFLGENIYIGTFLDLVSAEGGEYVTAFE